MTTGSLQESVDSLEASLPSLREHRASSPFANDIYEAVDYWRDLGRRALDGDAKVNYPERAREEKVLYEKLLATLRTRPPEEEQLYLGVLGAAQRLLNIIAAIPIDLEGYLGTLSVLKREFNFLQVEYGFRISNAEPTGVRYSSGAVYVELQYSIDPTFSCSFGPEGKDEVSFWVDDLLFLYGDKLYRTIGIARELKTKDQVQEWFSYIASIWKQYGREVLTNQPRIFDRLAEAQAMRDREHAAAINRQSDAQE